MAVSLDWLLFGTDAAGTPTSEIQYRGQSRDMPTLEKDLAAVLKRRLGEQGVALPSGYFGYTINPGALIEQAAESVREEFAGWQAYRAKVLPLRSGVAALAPKDRERMIDWLRSHSPKKEFLDTFEPAFGDDPEQYHGRSGFIDWV